MGPRPHINAQSERLQREVHVRSFSIAKSEVTVAQYQACVDAGVCSAPGSGESCNWGKSGRELHPINCVDWYQARIFSYWVGGDLPTETEWEYAARSRGQYITYPWGDETPSCEYAVMKINEKQKGCDQNSTWDVCSKPKGKSKQGVCDFVGNVWEWTLDQYQHDYSRTPIDGSPLCSQPRCMQRGVKRVIRGGSWSGDHKSLSSTHRDKDASHLWADYLGFRPRIQQQP